MKTRNLASRLHPTVLIVAACAATGEHEFNPEPILPIGQSAVANDGIMGLSIAISLKGKIVFAEGFGYADLERTQAASARTVYDIASVGKQFTAAAAMRLVEEGRLSLDDHLYDLVPETPLHFPNATIYQLLHHTSGFLSGHLDDLHPPAGLDQPRAGLERLDNASLKEGRSAFRPAETFVYCNSGYLMLGLVVEAVAGSPFQEVIAETLFEPANMTTATVSQRPESHLMADSLHRSEEGLARVPFIHMSVYGGAGSVCASVLDLLAWELALEQDRILSPDSLEQFRSPALVHGSSATAEIPYGMGQRIGTFSGFRKVGHTGTYAGGSAMIAHYPEAALTIVVLTNTNGNGTPHARSIEAKIASAILAPNFPDKPLHRTPLTNEERRQIEGHYSNGTVYEARVEGEDTLLVIREGKEIGRLVHTGDLVFRDPKLPGTRDWFLLDGDKAGWWAYEMDGFLMQVQRRVNLPQSSL